jgi:hypothetical protein
VFGGGTYDAFFDDLWELKPDPDGGYYWAALHPAGSVPPGRSTHMAVYDPDGQRMIVFGGRNRSSALSDVWALNLTDVSWQQLNPTGTAPGARCLAGAAYCPARRSMVFFGGTDLHTQHNDVWELNLDSAAWHRISAQGTAPSVRESHGAFVDDNRLIVFGGMSGGVFLNDMWALDLTPGSETWTRLSPSGSVPSIRATFGLGYDPDSRRLYLFGGILYPSTLYNDLYVCDMSSLTWTRLYPSGDSPCERRGAAGAFDPVNHRILVFGGEGYDGFLNDTYYADVANVALTEWQAASVAGCQPLLTVSSLNRGAVKLSYSVPSPGRVSVRILDPTGRVVRELFSGTMSRTAGTASWDGRDDMGIAMPAGSYFGYLQTERSGISRKFILTE